MLFDSYNTNDVVRPLSSTQSFHKEPPTSLFWKKYLARILIQQDYHLALYSKSEEKYKIPISETYQVGIVNSKKLRMFFIIKFISEPLTLGSL